MINPGYKQTITWSCSADGCEREQTENHDIFLNGNPVKADLPFDWVAVRFYGNGFEPSTSVFCPKHGKNIVEAVNNGKREVR